MYSSLKMSQNTLKQGNKPLALIFAILTRVKLAILMLATLVIFFSLLIKLFLKQKLPKQHIKTLLLIRFEALKFLRCPHLCRAKQKFYCLDPRYTLGHTSKNAYWKFFPKISTHFGICCIWHWRILKSLAPFRITSPSQNFY